MYINNVQIQRWKYGIFNDHAPLTDNLVVKMLSLEFQDFRSDEENKDGPEVPVGKFEKKMQSITNRYIKNYMKNTCELKYSQVSHLVNCFE